MTSSDFIGNETEVAFAKVFDGVINGGFGDGGNDVIVPGIGGVQVKSSVTGAKKFLVVSLQRKQFIPLCVGNPGTCDEMVASIKRFGAWVGSDIPGRQSLLEGIAQVRAMILQVKGAHA